MHPPDQGATFNAHAGGTVPGKHAGVGDKLKDTGSWLKDYGTALKHGRIKPYHATERKTRAATRNEPFGPTGAQLNELASLSFSPIHCPIIFDVLDMRLQYPADRWRNVYKSLSCLEFLCKRGGGDAVRSAQRLLPRLEYLENSFAYVTTDGRDVGNNVRHRARVIRALLQDDKRLKEEREAGARHRQRLVGGGFGATNATMGNGQAMEIGSGDGFGSNSSDNAFHREGTRQPHAFGSAAEGLHRPAVGHDRGGASHQHGATAELATPRHVSNGYYGSDSALRNSWPRPPHSPPAVDPKAAVSPEANSRHVATLKLLLALPRNALCADCALPGPGHRPSWASCSLGVFICMRCAGVHRGLGVHISQVRSCSLDTWLPSQVEFMAACGGNTAANKYWEAAMAIEERKVESLTDLDAFLRRKYIDKKYVKQGTVWPPSEPCKDQETSRALDAMLDEAERAEKEAARVANEEEAARADAVKAREAAAKAKAKADAQAQAMQTDLISLIDADAHPTPSIAMPRTVAAAENEADQERLQHSPLALLEEMFRVPQEDSRGQPAENDLAAKFSACLAEQVPSIVRSQPPTSLEAWDMGAALHALEAKEREEEQRRERDRAAAAHAAEAAQRRSVYHPPWAPAPAFQSPLGAARNGVATSSRDSSSAKTPTVSQLPLLFEGPASAFNDGFATVPHQFTNSPAISLPLPPSPQPSSASTAGGNSGRGTSSRSFSGGKVGALSRPSQGMQREPLRPHEQRAQQLLHGGLNAFAAHADLVAVKPVSPPGTGVQVGMKQLKLAETSRK